MHWNLGTIPKVFVRCAPEDRNQELWLGGLAW